MEGKDLSHKKDNSVIYGKKYIEILKKSPGWPSEEVFRQGPVAVIECIEEIPCNPCETVCPRDSITIGYPITNTPRFNGNCTGCGKCVVVCPGLAIFIVDYNYSRDEAAITIPYELIPMPDPGDLVSALDRNGRYVCEARIIKVVANKKNNKTNLVTIAVPKKYYSQIRFFKSGKKNKNSK